MAFTNTKLQEIKLDKVLNLISKKSEIEEFRKLCDSIEKRTQKLTEKAAARDASTGKTTEANGTAAPAAKEAGTAQTQNANASAASAPSTSAPGTAQKRKPLDGLEREAATNKKTVISGVLDKSSIPSTRIPKISAETKKVAPSKAGSSFFSAAKPAPKPT